LFHNIRAFYKGLNIRKGENAHSSSRNVVFMAFNSDNNLATPCGLYCGECLRYEKTCKGCIPSDGRPSWGKCETYACAAGKKIEHCGRCTEFPCNLFLNQYSKRLGPWRVFYKAGQLLYRKKIGTAAWIKEKVSGKNADPKVAVERCLEREKTQKKKQQKKNTGSTHV